MSTSVIDREMLLERLQRNSAQIKSYGVERLGVFGSFLRNTVTRESDVDLLVEFERGKKSFDNFMDLGIYLEELLNRKVELVTPQSLSKHIGPHILKQVQDVKL
ncbi:nucleotidyltransferase family protein [Flavihumibacter sp. RY-1]|uniref:Nucleotidyltransferase family protein n=1 Tax=Flavihumibacter fluminis TaxID=2909236 RepID=A0ABS9BFE8_9BACT|nr:nucleotidyltransferase family protein [Flavihumibacter fluminis]MCF1714432.1 nucleotidyltransferase family protein [Flavihumibacter fluminis]